MKLGKIFICINILVLSLLMLTGCTEKWPRIIYQNTSYRFDEYNRTIVLDDGGHSYDIVETENGYDIIKEQYYNSITNTTIHVETRIPQYQNNYSVMPEDRFSLESKEQSRRKKASTLLPVIEAFKPTYYAWNNKHLNRGMYLDRALYSL